MTRRIRGFTLVEVLIALSIMSLVMVALYSSLDATLRARDQIEIESRVARLGPEILDIVEADLRRAWVLGILDDQVFRGEARMIDGEPADSLSLLTHVDSTMTRRVDEREVPSDVCETGYRLRRNPLLPDVRELWRRQSFHVDEQPLENDDHGVYELLHDRVVRFQVRYREDVDRFAEELHDWDASARHRLPALVEVELALEAVPRTVADMASLSAASRTLVYRRSIPLGGHSDLVMRVHAIPPTFTGAGGTSGSTGPGGPDSDGDGIRDSEDADPNDPNVPVVGGDKDADGDGVPAGVDPDDNDPDVPGSGDGSGDGSGAGSGDDGGLPDNPFGGGTGGDFNDFLDDLLGSGGGGGG
ncbi:MAG: prepilin-type N-terminal cleavage/methylation domain-containing protein [Planctomycetes bacterium]|nr:prepilin-type N-terminal cleavage/methylation domain-containing protein [Planctomycetota bacterium]